MKFIGHRNQNFEIITEDNITDYIYMGNYYSPVKDPLYSNKIGIWLNRKPIYRKVFYDCNFGGGSNAWASTGQTIENVETLVNAHAIRTTDKAVVNHFSFRMNNNDIQYYTNTAFTGCDILVVEYTKTTD